MAPAGGGLSRRRLCQGQHRRAAGRPQPGHLDLVEPPDHTRDRALEPLYVRLFPRFQNRRRGNVEAPIRVLARDLPGGRGISRSGAVQPQRRLTGRPDPYHRRRGAASGAADAEHHDRCGGVMSMRFCLSALISLLVLAAAPASAQQYPSRPVTIVVPFAAGGGSDLLARLVAQKLEEKLGKPFIIENRPGAGTTLAAMQAVRSTPDGYTLMQATSTTMAINVSVQKKMPYEPLKDLVPVALLSSSPFFLVVKSDSPV